MGSSRIEYGRLARHYLSIGGGSNHDGGSSHRVSGGYTDSEDDLQSKVKTFENYASEIISALKQALGIKSSDLDAAAKEIQAKYSRGFTMDSKMSSSDFDSACKSLIGALENTTFYKEFVGAVSTDSNRSKCDKILSSMNIVNSMISKSPSGVNALIEKNVIEIETNLLVLDEILKLMKDKVRSTNNHQYINSLEKVRELMKSNLSKLKKVTSLTGDKYSKLIIEKAVRGQTTGPSAVLGQILNSMAYSVYYSNHVKQIIEKYKINMDKYLKDMNPDELGSDIVDHLIRSGYNFEDGDIVEDGNKLQGFIQILQSSDHASREEILKKVMAGESISASIRSSMPKDIQLNIGAGRKHGGAGADDFKIPIIKKEKREVDQGLSRMSRIAKNKKASKVFTINVFQQKLKERIYNVYKAVEPIASSVGFSIPVSDHLEYLREAIIKLRPYLGRTDAWAALSGLYDDAQSLERRDSFFISLNSIKSIAQTMMNTPANSPIKEHLQDLSNSCDGIIELYNEYSKIFHDNFTGDIVKGYGRHSKYGGDLSNALENPNEYINPHGLTKDLGNDIIHKSPLLLSESIDKLGYYMELAQINQNVTKNSKNIDAMLVPYNAIRAESVGKKVDDIKLYYKKLKKQIDRLKDPTVVNTKAVSEFIDNKQNAEIEFYRALEAIDEYLLRFNKQIIMNYKNLKSIQGILESTDDIYDWYNNDTRAYLMAVYNGFPKGNNTMNDHNKGVKTIIQGKLNLMKAMNAAADPMLLGDPNKPCGEPSIYNDAPERVNEFMKRFYLLKNILSAFIRTVANVDENVYTDIFMKPSEIYKRLVEYLKYCSFTFSSTQLDYIKKPSVSNLYDMETTFNVMKKSFDKNFDDADPNSVDNRLNALNQLMEQFNTYKAVELPKILNQHSSQLKLLESQTDDINDNLASLLSIVPKSGNFRTQLKKAIDDLKTNINELTASDNEYVKRLNNLGAKVRINETALEMLTNTVNDQTKDLTENLRLANNKIDVNTAKIDQTRKVIENSAEKVEESILKQITELKIPKNLSKELTEIYTAINQATAAQGAVLKANTSVNSIQRALDLSNILDDQVQNGDKSGPKLTTQMDTDLGNIIKVASNANGDLSNTTIGGQIDNLINDMSTHFKTNNNKPRKFIKVKDTADSELKATTDNYNVKIASLLLKLKDEWTTQQGPPPGGAPGGPVTVPVITGHDLVSKNIKKAVKQFMTDWDNGNAATELQGIIANQTAADNTTKTIKDAYDNQVNDNRTNPDRERSYLKIIKNIGAELNQAVTNAANPQAIATATNNQKQFIRNEVHYRNTMLNDKHNINLSDDYICGLQDIVPNSAAATAFGNNLKSILIMSDEKYDRWQTENLRLARIGIALRILKSNHLSDLVNGNYIDFANPPITSAVDFKNPGPIRQRMVDVLADTLYVWSLSQKHLRSNVVNQVFHSEEIMKYSFMRSFPPSAAQGKISQLDTNQGVINLVIALRLNRIVNVGGNYPSGPDPMGRALLYCGNLLLFNNIQARANRIAQVTIDINSIASAIRLNHDDTNVNHKFAHSIGTLVVRPNDTGAEYPDNTNSIKTILNNIINKFTALGGNAGVVNVEDIMLMMSTVTPYASLFTKTAIHAYITNSGATAVKGSNTSHLLAMMEAHPLFKGVYLLYVNNPASTIDSTIMAAYPPTGFPVTRTPRNADNEEQLKAALAIMYKDYTGANLRFNAGGAPQIANPDKLERALNVLRLSLTAGYASVPPARVEEVFFNVYEYRSFIQYIYYALPSPFDYVYAMIFGLNVTLNNDVVSIFNTINKADLFTFIRAVLEDAFIKVYQGKVEDFNFVSKKFKNTEDLEVASRLNADVQGNYGQRMLNATGEQLTPAGFSTSELSDKVIRKINNDIAQPYAGKNEVQLPPTSLNDKFKGWTGAAPAHAIAVANQQITAADFVAVAYADITQAGARAFWRPITTNLGTLYKFNQIIKINDSQLRLFASFKALETLHTLLAAVSYKYINYMIFMLKTTYRNMLNNPQTIAEKNAFLTVIRDFDVRAAGINLELCYNYFDEFLSKTFIENYMSAVANLCRHLDGPNNGIALHDIVGRGRASGGAIGGAFGYKQSKTDFKLKMSNVGDLVGDLDKENEVNLFADVIKAMCAKILTVVNIQLMKTKPMKVGINDPVRSILGGASNVPEIIPEAVTFYVRSALLLEFYRSFFKPIDYDNATFIDFNRKFKGADEITFKAKIALYPGFDGKFINMYKFMFIKNPGKSLVSFSLEDLKNWIEICNKVWVSSQTNSSDSWRSLIDEIVDDINKRYGIVKKEEIELLLREMNEGLEYSNFSSLNDRNEFHVPLLPDENNIMINSVVSPSMEYENVDTTNISVKEKVSMNYLYNQYRYMLREFRMRVDKYFIHISDNDAEYARIQDHQPLESGQLDNKSTLKNTLRSSKENMLKLQDPEQKINSLLKTIKSNLLSKSNDIYNMMFHETVVSGLNLLSGVYSIVKKFHTQVVFSDIGEMIEECTYQTGAPHTITYDRSDYQISGGASAQADNLAKLNLIRALKYALYKKYISADTTYTQFNAQVAFGDANYDYELSSSILNPKHINLHVNAHQINGADAVNIKQLMYARVLNINSIIGDLVESLLALGTDLNGLVTVDIISDNIEIDFSKLEKYVKNLMQGVKYFMEKLQPHVSQKIYETYTKKMTPGSYYWFQEQFVEKLFQGRQSPYKNLGSVKDSIEIDKKVVYVPLRDLGPKLTKIFKDVMTQSLPTPIDKFQLGQVFARKIFYDNHLDEQSGISGSHREDTTDIVSGSPALPVKLQDSMDNLLVSNKGDQIQPHPQLYVRYKQLYTDMHDDIWNNNASLLFAFNQGIAKYIKLCYDTSAKKIYKNCLASIVQGPLNESISDFDKKCYPDVFRGENFVKPVTSSSIDVDDLYTLGFNGNDIDNYLYNVTGVVTNKLPTAFTEGTYPTNLDTAIQYAPHAKHSYTNPQNYERQQVNNNNFDFYGPLPQQNSVKVFLGTIIKYIENKGYDDEKFNSLIAIALFNPCLFLPTATPHNDKLSICYATEVYYYIKKLHASPTNAAKLYYSKLDIGELLNNLYNFVTDPTNNVNLPGPILKLLKKVKGSKSELFKISIDEYLKNNFNNVEREKTKYISTGENLHNTILEAVSYPDAVPANMKFGRRTDPSPRRLLYNTLALKLHSLYYDENPKSRKSIYLLDSFSEISHYKKEEFRAYLPFMRNHFKTLVEKCKVLVKLLKMKNLGCCRVDNSNLDQNTPIVADVDYRDAKRGVGLINPQDIDDTDFNYITGHTSVTFQAPGGRTNEISNKTKSHFTNVINSIMKACSSVLSSINQIEKELDDSSPKYLEFEENGIKKHSDINKQDPFMPLSTMLTPLLNKNSKSSRTLLYPKFYGHEHFKIAYGLRFLYNEKSNHKNVGWDNLINLLNNSDLSKNLIDKKVAGNYLDSFEMCSKFLVDITSTKLTSATMSRYYDYSGAIDLAADLVVRRTSDELAAAAVMLLSTDHNDALNHANSPSAGIELDVNYSLPPSNLSGTRLVSNVELAIDNVNFKSNTLITTIPLNNFGAGLPGVQGIRSLKPVYQLYYNRSIQEITSLSENTEDSDAISTISDHMFSETRDEEQLMIINLLDMNIVPIRMHNVSNYIPFANIINFSYSFERMAARSLYNNSSYGEFIVSRITYGKDPILDNTTVLNTQIYDEKYGLILLINNPYRAYAGGELEAARILFDPARCRNNNLKFLTDVIGSDIVFDIKSTHEQDNTDMEPESNLHHNRTRNRRTTINSLDRQNAPYNLNAGNTHLESHFDSLLTRQLMMMVSSSYIVKKAITDYILKNNDKSIIVKGLKSLDENEYKFEHPDDVKHTKDYLAEPSYGRDTAFTDYSTDWRN